MQKAEERFLEKDGLQEESVHEFIIELEMGDDMELRDIEFEGGRQDKDGEQDQYKPVVTESDSELLR